MKYTFKSSLNLAALILVGGAIACTSTSQKPAAQTAQPGKACPIDTLYLSTEKGDASRFRGDASTTRFVILQEEDPWMFSEIRQVIDAFGKFFIVDKFERRQVLAFDRNGKPVALYGKRGNGPGEYLFPWTVKVSADYVYVLDASRRKLNLYRHDGKFVRNYTVPFSCKGFTLLDNQRFLFQLEPSEESHHQLCITDSTLTPMRTLLPYPDHYVGGWGTDTPFQETPQGIYYYCSPADTIYQLDYQGRLIGKRLLQFANGPMDELTKLDFIQAEESGKLDHGMHLLNNPYVGADGRCWMEVTNYTDPGTYIVISYPQQGWYGAQKFGDHLSVYDVITPCALSEQGEIISFLDQAIAEKCDDYTTLADSLQRTLQDGDRILVIHSPR